MPTKTITWLRATALLVFCVSVMAFAGQSAYGEGSGLTEPPDTEKTTTMNERLKMRRDELKLKITDDNKKRLVARCVGAQKMIKQLKSRDATVRDKHHRAYLLIAERLNAMISKLERQGLSTAALQNAQQQFKDAVNEYLADAQDYKTAINDLAAMGCASDSEGFQASLQTARALRQQLAQDTAVIKEAIAQVKTALAEAKQALRQSSASDSGAN